MLNMTLSKHAYIGKTLLLYYLSFLLHIHQPQLVSVRNKADN